MYFAYIRISIALKKLEATRVRAFIYWYSVAANHCKDLWLSLAQMVVELTSKQWLAMVFFCTTAVDWICLVWTQKITIIFFIIVRNGVFALFTYLNLYGGFTCLVVVFFLPLLRFFTREFVGVSLREVLSVFEVLSTLEVSS